MSIDHRLVVSVAVTESISVQDIDSNGKDQRGHAQLVIHTQSDS